MKKLIMAFLFTTLFVEITLSQERRETIDDRPAVITGQVLHPEVYSRYKDLVLQIPYFQMNGSEIVERCDIGADGAFSFSFRPYVTREVMIQTFVPSLVVSPGDSLHVVIDFMDLGNVKFSGPAAKINREWSIFMNEGFYQEMHLSSAVNEWQERAFLEHLDHENKTANLRRREFIAKYKPSEIVQKCTKRLLDADYYMSRLTYYAFPARDGKKKYADFDRSFAFTTDMEKCYTSDFVLMKHFALAQVYANVYQVERWSRQHGQAGVRELDVQMRMQKEMPPGNALLHQYLLCTRLYYYVEMRDLGGFEREWNECQEIIKAPFLLNPLLERYKIMKHYDCHPEEFTGDMLQGNIKKSSMKQDGVKSIPLHDRQENMGIKRLREVMKEHEKKVIYINLWGVGCGPCIQAMQAEKELIEKFEPRGVAFVSLCSGDSTRWRNLIHTYQFKGEHHLLTKHEFREISKVMKINSIPYTILVDKQGNLAFCGHLAPLSTWTAKKLEELLDRN